MRNFISQNIVGDDSFADDFEELIFEPYTIMERVVRKSVLSVNHFRLPRRQSERVYAGVEFRLRLDTLQTYV